MEIEEAKKLPVGTMLVSIGSGEVTVTKGKTRRCVELIGKPWGIIVGNDCLPLKPSGWRLATREEVESVYRSAISAIDKEWPN